MLRKILALLGAGPLVLGSGAALAAGSDEATLEILASTIQANRKALVAVNLDLTDEEASAFWPLYDRYQKELGETGRRLVDVIGEYGKGFGKLSDDEAQDLVQRYLAVDRDRNELRRRYLGPFSKVLPGKKVMRFYQVEHKMDAVLRYEMAAQIPVVEP
ncbi:MAG: hypothetical protein QNK04_13545 [Myxococcota bacterium]|nr:hypothetical protein [Myxococcota bacterium]